MNTQPFNRLPKEYVWNIEYMEIVDSKFALL